MLDSHLTPDAFRAAADAARADGHARLVVPVYRRRSADLLTPVSAFLAMRQGARYPFLLESVEGGETLARYSFLGRDPYALVTARGADTRIERIGPDGPAAFPDRADGDVFATLRTLMADRHEVRLPGLPRLTGGAVGYLGYDAVRLVEHLPDAPPDDLDLPDAVLALYSSVAAFDHVRHQLVLLSNAYLDPGDDPEQAYADATARLDALERSLMRPPAPPAPVRLTGPTTSNTTRERWTESVETARRHIVDGDIFQVVLSQRFEMPFEGDRFNLYRALRQVNPSPYLFFLDLETHALVGSSPEVLVRVEDGRADVLPIAGTRPRGASPEVDAALAEELMADPKERAEHVMLVDLGRNDLGRVCRTGSVQVDDYARIERFSHVMHIVSSVSGDVAPGRDAVDVLAACFPAGTVSGAPKVRAMQIIDALEPTRRGPYAGAVGYLDHSGNLDTCIAIRTMLVQGGRIYIQAGAGIVADSRADAEYAETENKARALRRAIEVAAEGLL